MRNAGTQPADALVEFIVSDGEKGLFKTTARAPIAAGDTGVLEGFLDTSRPHPLGRRITPPCTPVSAVLYRDGKPVDAVRKITGFRTFTAEHGQLLLNGEPLMLRGVGHEYFSVSISPLIDKALIRRRFQCIKAHGFNFCRYHTHPPTEEELCIADEVGILLSSEIALISNMSKVSPAEKCLTILEKQILATKHHPSMGIYCLGNEGSQIMVANYLEREKALAGYQLIKRPRRITWPSSPSACRANCRNCPTTWRRPISGATISSGRTTASRISPGMCWTPPCRRTNPG